MEYIVPKVGMKIKTTDDMRSKFPDFSDCDSWTVIRPAAGITVGPIENVVENKRGNKFWVSPSSCGPLVFEVIFCFDYLTQDQILKD